MNKKYDYKCPDCGKNLGNFKGIKSTSNGYICSKCFKIGKKLKWSGYKG